MVVVFPASSLAPGDSVMSSQIEESDFEYIRIEELSAYWRMKIRGWGYGASSRPCCPYDGGGLVSYDLPIDHVQCIKCGRNYA